jgi:tetratricopeptide (TPR) repeat protein
LIDLKINLQISKDIEMTKKIDKFVNSLFESQRMVRSKNYDGAIAELNKAEAIFPFVSSVYEIKGSVFYLKKNYPESLSFYRKAVSINPENIDAYNLKLYLEKNFNLKND